MSGMEKLLTKIKALFGPTGPAVPTPDVAETAAPPSTIRETPQAEGSQPIVTVDEPASAEEAPTAVADSPAPPDAANVPAVAAPLGALVLRLESERGPNPTFAVTKSGATIGRGAESTIRLADLSVSRKHARITYRQGAYWLSDLGSMGGTWIDGTKLAAPRRVAAGQTIDIGVCRLTVLSAEADEAASAAKGPSHAA